MKAPTTHTHKGVSYEIFPPDFKGDKWMGFVWKDGHIVRVEFGPTKQQVAWQCIAWINWTKAA